MPAQTRGPILLRDMGSFHIGGRHIEVRGQPVKEIVFTPGGVPAKVDPNGVYQVEQMYAQYFLVQNRKGKLPLGQDPPECRQLCGRGERGRWQG